MLYDYKIKPFGERAALVEFAALIDPSINAAAVALANSLRMCLGITEVTPAYRSVLLEYDPALYNYQAIVELIQTAPISFTNTDNKSVYEIPVCYGGDFGPDIDTVARLNSITIDEVISIHSEREYQVYMLGFLPGFPYLGGLSSKIATPRLENPRLAIPAGAVGIAGTQTGFYPVSSPGGWQLIGRTPLKLFDPNRQQPFLLSAGNWLRFVPISRIDFFEMVNKND